MAKNLKRHFFISSSFIVLILAATCLSAFFMTGKLLFIGILALSLVPVIIASYSIFRRLGAHLSATEEILKSIGTFTGRDSTTPQTDISQELNRIREFFEKNKNTSTDLNNHASTVNSFMSVLLDSAKQTSSRSDKNSQKIETITKSIIQMESSLTSVARELEQSTMNVNTIASAAEEMSLTSREISESISKTGSITRNAVDQASEISNHVNDLGKSANEIGAVIETINEISAQTNLLALNATIEAARAGEAGKGFAVVANEIKELSRQTEEATVEIKRKIEGIQKSTEYTVSKMENIYSSIRDSNDIVENISSAISEQNLAIGEIARNIAITSTSVSSVNQDVSVCSEMSRKVSESITEIKILTNDVMNDSIKMEILAKEATSLTAHIKGMASDENGQNPSFDISKVKNAHLNWRVNLESALRGYKKIRVEDVADHHGCDFGKWYDSSGQIFSSFDIFREVGRHHEQVHVFIKKIISLINAGQRKEAEGLIDEFEKVRENLFDTLDELYREA